MMRRKETEQEQEDPKDAVKESNTVGIETSMISPRFKSVAAMAGWDEEALLIATLVVEDTPEREFKHKKRSDLQFKTPPTNSRRKRKTRRRSPSSIPVSVLDLDGEETVKEDTDSVDKKEEHKLSGNEEMGTKEDELSTKSSGVSCSSSSILPCMDKLREELSCAICLEICFEPSTTTCGHSFCKKCLRSAADKCGKKCPKCRQLISNGRSCTVNTVLWNTIQLLFPQEIESRKGVGALNTREAEVQSPERSYNTNERNRSVRPSRVSSRIASVRSQEAENQNPERGSNQRIRPSSRISSRDVSVRRRRGVPSQDVDAALALRLQREEFMEAFRGSNEQSTISSLSLARANLRAMASRAMNLRLRGRPI